MDFLQRTVFQLLLCAECQEIFILRRYEFWTIQGEQRLPFAYHLSGVIDEEIVHPTGNAQIDMGNPLFVVVHAPDRANRSVQWVLLHYGSLDADESLCGRSDHGEGLRCTVIMDGGHRAMVLRLLAGSR